MKRWVTLGVTFTLVLTFIVSCGGPKAATTGEASIYKLAEEGKSSEVIPAIKRGFEVDKPDENGQTLLHHAVIGNQVTLVELLLEDCRANKSLKDKDGYLPIDYTDPGSEIDNLLKN